VVGRKARVFFKCQIFRKNGAASKSVIGEEGKAVFAKATRGALSGKKVFQDPLYA